MAPVRETTVTYGENGNGRRNGGWRTIGRAMSPVLAISLCGGLVGIGANVYTQGAKQGAAQERQANFERTVKEEADKRDAALWTELGKVWKNDEYNRDQREKLREKIDVMLAKISDLSGDVKVIRNMAENAAARSGR